MVESARSGGPEECWCSGLKLHAWRTENREEEEMAPPRRGSGRSSPNAPALV